MPLFIFISGLFFKSSLNKDIKTLLFNKTKRLLLPTFVYSTIIILLCTIIIHIPPTIGFLYKQYSCYWYLICLFLLTIFYFFFYKSNIFTRCIIIILYITAVVCYDYLPGKILKDCQIIRQTFIFGIGTFISVYWQSYFKELNYLKKTIAIILCTIFIVVIRLCFGFNMMDYPIYIRILDGFVCSMMVLHLIYGILQRIQSLNICKPLIYLGQNSLGIYLIHAVVVRIFKYTDCSIEYNMLNIVILTALLLLGSVFIIEVIKRSTKSYSFIFGV